MALNASEVVAARATNLTYTYIRICQVKKCGPAQSVSGRGRLFVAEGKAAQRLRTDGVGHLRSVDGLPWFLTTHSTARIFTSKVSASPASTTNASSPTRIPLRA